MPRAFNDDEKREIKQKLIEECKKSWSAHGYKKTSVAELCLKVGISTGAFYSFYNSKEDLFCDVMDDFRDGTRRMYDEVLSTPPKKSEIREALKRLYKEFAENDIITKRHGHDYQSLLNKVPKEWKKRHAQKGIDNLAATLFAPGVGLKIPEELAKGIVDTLLLTVVNKDNIKEHYEIFCILLDAVIDDIYE